MWPTLLRIWSRLTVKIHKQQHFRCCLLYWCIVKSLKPNNWIRKYQIPTIIKTDDVADDEELSEPADNANIFTCEKQTNKQC